MSKFAAFTEGLLGGMERGSQLRTRNEQNQLYKEDREDRALAKDLSKRAAGINIDTTSDRAIGDRLAGPPTPDGQAPTVQGGRAQIDQYRQEVMQIQDPKRQRKLLDQLDEMAVRSITSLWGLASRSEGQDPEDEVKYLNRSADLAGLGSNYFKVENGKVVSPDGPVTRDTYGFMLEYARDPAKGIAWYRQATRENKQDTLAENADRRAGTLMELQIKGFEHSKFIDMARLRQQDRQISQQYQMSLMGHNLTLMQMNERTRQFDKQYGLELEKLENQAALTGAQVSYYDALGAYNRARASAAQVQTPFKDPKDQVKALESFDKQFEPIANPNGLVGGDPKNPEAAETPVSRMFTDEYAAQFATPGGAVPTGEEVRQRVIHYGREAIVEHGEKALANARQGAEHALAFLLGDPEASVIDVKSNSLGQWQIVVEEGGGQFTYPVSSNIGMNIQAMRQATAEGDAQAALSEYPAAMAAREEEAKAIFSGGADSAAARGSGIPDSGVGQQTSLDPLVRGALGGVESAMEKFMRLPPGFGWARIGAMDEIAGSLFGGMTLTQLPDTDATGYPWPSGSRQALTIE
jgi:hypothetical protein